MPLQRGVIHPQMHSLSKNALPPVQAKSLADASALIFSANAPGNVTGGDRYGPMRKARSTALTTGTTALFAHLSCGV